MAAHDMLETTSLHGIRLLLPVDWEVVGTYGLWERGQVLIGCGRQPRMSVGWQRSGLPPDLERSLAGAGRRLRRDHGCQAVGSVKAINDGLIGTWEADGVIFCAAVRHIRASGVTLIWRDLVGTPGQGQPPALSAPSLERLSGLAEATADDAPTQWRVYGLDIDLPPWWRMERIEQSAGLVRGLWCLHPRGGRSPAAVLVMRRLACAHLLLGEGGISAWIRSRLGRNERVETAERDDDGVVAICASRPARALWSRWRGGRDERHIHGWIEPAMDRLLIQEWKGDGEPLPCLRAQQAEKPGVLTAARMLP